MKLFLSLTVCCLSVSAVCAAGIEGRSEPVLKALEKQLKKKAKDITADDLAKVTELELPHLHIKKFKDDDFDGLKNLKKLKFHSLLHNGGTPKDPVTISNEVFGGMDLLEELTIEDELGLLPDEVFSGLRSLKVLNLSGSTLNRLPMTMLTLPSIEKVYYDGAGMTKEEYEKLKKTYGNKLSPFK